jgi:hypothetical protein
VVLLNTWYPPGVAPGALAQFLGAWEASKKKQFPHFFNLQIDQNINFAKLPSVKLLFLLVLNFRKLNISGLLGDLERNIFAVSCLYYYNAAGQPKTSPKPAQNQPKIQPKTCTNLKLC